jgi:two-component system, NtrC family, sensor kinase
MADARAGFSSPEERELLMDAFRHIQVGQCVSSVTHDVNNHLGVIMAYAEILALDLKLGEESQSMLDEIVSGVHRSSALINSLTDIARDRKRPDVRVMSLDQLLSRVLDLQRYDFKVRHIELEEKVCSGLPTMAMDLARLQLAFLHLIRNTLDALEDVEEKRARVTVAAEEEGFHVAIWDSAPAIPEDQREAVFEPFFTTRTGTHLGLGLPSARRVVEEHGGRLTYDPEEGFVAWLPKQNPFVQD